MRTTDLFLLSDLIIAFIGFQLIFLAIFIYEPSSFFGTVIGMLGTVLVMFPLYIYLYEEYHD